MKFVKKEISGQGNTVYQITIGRAELNLILDMSKQFKKHLLKTLETNSTNNRLNNFIKILTRTRDGDSKTSE